MEEKKRIQELIAIIQEEIEKISTAFYQRKDSIAYQVLNLLIQNMTELINELDGITNEYTRLINRILAEILQALKDKDGVLVADMLRYDLNHILNRIDMEL